MISTASGLTGCLKVCMEASNGPCTHIGCCVQRQRLDQWHCSGQAVEMIHNHGTNARQCTWLQMGWAVLEKTKYIWWWIAALGMGGCVQVCIGASNEPCIHKSTSDAVCRDNARPVALWKWYRNMGLNTSQCTWLQMGWAVLWKNPKTIYCKLLHGEWEGVYRSVLQRLLSLISTIASDVVCRNSVMGFNASQCTWLQMWSAVLRNKPSKNDCEMLHWAWEAAEGPELKRATSLVCVYSH